MTDHRGTQIEIGKKVCFNYCGTIGYGEIIKIIPRKEKDQFNIHVKRSYPIEIFWKGTGISIIKKPTNLMVIFENGN